MEGVAVSVHVQHVHREVVGREVEGGKHLSQAHLLTIFAAHYLIRVILDGLLDETQQMLLVHAGRSVDVSVHLQPHQTLGNIKASPLLQFFFMYSLLSLVLACLFYDSLGKFNFL